MADVLNLEFDPPKKRIRRKRKVSDHFNCGHPKNEKNSIKKITNGYLRFICRICQNASNAAYARRNRDKIEAKTKWLRFDRNKLTSDQIASLKQMYAEFIGDKE